MTAVPSSAPANLVLALAGLALAITLAFDLVSDRRESSAALHQAAAPPGTTDVAGVAGIEALRAFVERPPFAPSRRPASQAAPVVGAAPLVPPNLELVGIVAAGEDAFALLRPPGGRVQRLAIGQSIGDWRLDSIERDRITLSHEGRRAVVPLLRRAPAQPMPVSEPWLVPPQPAPGR